MDVFASADLGHPAKLVDAGYAGSKVAIFARNELCAPVREGVEISPDGLLETMLDPTVRLATSTPKADPSGDYAFALFAKADAVKPGARSTLEVKALQLTGGPILGEGAGRAEQVCVDHGDRQGRCVPDLLHQCDPGAARAGEPAGRPHSPAAERGRGVWDGGPQRCADAYDTVGSVHIERGGTGDAGAAWLRSRQRAAKLMDAAAGMQSSTSLDLMMTLTSDPFSRPNSRQRRE